MTIENEMIKKNTGKKVIEKIDDRALIREFVPKDIIRKQTLFLGLLSFRTMFAAIKTIYYSTKKRSVLKMIDHSLDLEEDTLIFGLNGTAMNFYNSFYPFCRFCKKNKVKFIPLRYNFRNSPDSICTKLKQDIAHYTKNRSYERIIFIGHSYGGIIARYLITKYLGDDKRFELMTVSSPNNGVDISGCNFTEKIIYKIICLLVPETRGSSTLEYLEKNPLKKTNITIITGKKDMLVPGDAAYIGKHKPDIELDSEDHLSILYSQALFQVILKIYNNKIKP